jgi:hypothetical protein
MRKDRGGKVWQRSYIYVKQYRLSNPVDLWKDTLDGTNQEVTVSVISGALRSL